MKHRIIFLVLALCMALSASAVNFAKQTRLYAVKGADSLYLDRYTDPSVKGERPCVIFVFGGGFVGGNRSRFQAYKDYYEWLVSEGYDVVAIDYRLGLKNIGKSDGQQMGTRAMIAALSNSVTIAVEDLLDATRYVLDQKEWQIDPKAIVVSGSSAGAITVLQAENDICNRADGAKVLPEKFNYAGVISFAGAIFSTTGAPKWASKPCPVMLFHGSSDSNVPYDKVSILGIGFYGSKTLVKQFEKLGSPYYFYDEQYQTHQMAVSPMSDNQDEIKAFLDRFVIGKQALAVHQQVQNMERDKAPTKFGIGDYIRSNYKL